MCYVLYIVNFIVDMGVSVCAHFPESQLLNAGTPLPSGEKPPSQSESLPNAHQAQARGLDRQS